MKSFKLIAVATFMSSALTNVQAADLSVEIAGIAEAKGEVLVSLFNKSEGWLRKGAGFSKAIAQVGGGQGHIHRLAPGRLCGLRGPRRE